MNMIIIENEVMRVLIKEKGAELSSIFLKSNQTEYMYQADERYWNKQAPILFPCVGMLKNQQFTYQGEVYSMLKHGFARDYEFDIDQLESNHVVFKQTNESLTLRNYPFPFTFYVEYSLVENSLQITYKILAGNQEGYFAVGGHPAFKVPLEQGLTYEDYSITFESESNLVQLPLSGPFIADEEAILWKEKSFNLNHQLFTNDLLLFKTPEQVSIRLSTKKDKKGVVVNCDDFPYVGIWSLTNDAPYVCIEPWQSLPDYVNASMAIEEKESYIHLQPQEEFTCSYSISCY